MNEIGIDPAAGADWTRVVRVATSPNPPPMGYVNRSSWWGHDASVGWGPNDLIESVKRLVALTTASEPKKSPPPPTLAALLTACEKEPSPAAFAATSDYYREAGDDRMADAFDWMGRHYRHPLKDMACMYIWYDESVETENPFCKAKLPSVIFKAKSSKNWGNGLSYVRGSSFLSAVEWLADRIAAVKGQL